MHFDILVEDQSGKKSLEILVPKILANGSHTYTIHSYKGIGRIPRGLKSDADPKKRLLLSQLPRLLRGFGKTHTKYGNFQAALLVLCDLDNKCLKKFREELLGVLSTSNPKPETRFCIAVEEGEAWLLGDRQAIKTAYPNAKNGVLNSYVQDSICGTWECLADAVFPGGAKALSQKGWQAIGAEKSLWSINIAPHMNVQENVSSSFQYFRKKILALLEAG